MICPRLVAAMLLAVAGIGLTYNQLWAAGVRSEPRSDRLAPPRPSRLWILLQDGFFPQLYRM